MRTYERGQRECSCGTWRSITAAEELDRFFFERGVRPSDCVALATEKNAGIQTRTMKLARKTNQDSLCLVVTV